MTGGRILHHALRLVPDPETTIIFVGYQAAGTTGRRILEGEPEVKIMGQWVPVRCRVTKISGFSAHADRHELVLFDINREIDLDHLQHLVVVVDDRRAATERR